VLDDVFYVLRLAPGLLDRNDIALPDRVAGVVDQSVAGLLEVLNMG